MRRGSLPAQLETEGGGQLVLKVALDCLIRPGEQLGDVVVPVIPRTDGAPAAACRMNEPGWDRRSVFAFTDVKLMKRTGRR